MDNLEKLVTINISKYLLTLFHKEISNISYVPKNTIFELYFVTKCVKEQISNIKLNNILNYDNIDYFCITVGNIYSVNKSYIINEYLNTPEFGVVEQTVYYIKDYYNFVNDLDDAINCYIFDSMPIKINIMEYKDKIHDFNYNRLKPTVEDSYPEYDRPRGNEDIESVIHHINLLKNGEELLPISLINKDGKLYMLDGYHRIVASYIEEKYDIMANIIYI